MSVKVEITDLAYGGRGVGRIDGKVIFVPYTAPGDVAMVEVTTEKKGFSEGVLTDLVEPSPDRTEPECRYYGECGGCSLQHIRYERQVELKGRIFTETLRRIGHVDFDHVDDPIPSPSPYGYRTRARFHTGGGAVGFFREGSNSIVDITECPVLTPELNAAYSSVRDALIHAAGEGEGAAGDNGAIDAIYAFEITCAPGTGRFGALFHVTRPKVGPEIERALAGVSGLTGFEVRHDARRNFQGEAVYKSGDTTLKYIVQGVELRASAGSFMQANPAANELLVGRALEYAGAAEGGGGSTALDLYSGAGNITIPLAMAGFDVTGVESVEESIALGRKSIPRTTPGRVVFKRGRVSTWLKQNFNTLESSPPDVIILDPPRAAEKGVAGSVADIRPGRVVYVSCSPPVLARDLAVFVERGYRAERCSVIDMFPQTFHIEGLASLKP